MGHLYQGRYNAYLIEKDSYLLEVSRYIHLNPVRTKRSSRKSLEERWRALLKYKWSSLPGYLSVRRRQGFIDYRTVLDYMGGDNRKGREEYRRFIQEGIAQEQGSPLKIGKGHGIVGGVEFIGWIKEKFLGEATSQREQPAVRALGKEYRPGDLIENYVNLTGQSKKDMCSRNTRSIERAMLMELLYRFCRITQCEIGKLVGGIDYSTVSNARRRLRTKMAIETKISERFSQICDRLVEMKRRKT